MAISFITRILQKLGLGKPPAEQVEDPLDLEEIPAPEPLEIEELPEPEPMTLEDLGLTVEDLPPLELPSAVSAPNITKEAIFDEYSATDTLRYDVERVRADLNALIRAPKILDDDGVEGDILCKVKSSEVVSGQTVNWKYTLQRVRLTGLGPVTFEVIPDTADLTDAYFMEEVPNPSASGSTKAHGNGVYPDDMDIDGDGTAEYEIKAVQNDTLVLAKPVSTTAGTTGYLFYVANNVFTGGCPEPAE
jgi:hypothetical protein